jgi:uncharacterized protein YbcC (UPF0753/DUF2309 family)
MDRFTAYIAIKDFIKSGKELQERVGKYQSSLRKNGEKLQADLDARVQELESAKARIEQDITDIWDDLMEVKTSEDVSDLIERINLVLQKGISYNDQSSLEEIGGNLEAFLIDIDRLSATDLSRGEFKAVSVQLLKKYEDSEFDFEVNEILDEVIKTVAGKLDQKEAEWRKVNLSLGDKKRASVHYWKEKIKYLPEFLSEKTHEDIKKIDAEANEIIKEGKIEDVVFYFEKLDHEEKEECIAKLQDLI